MAASVKELCESPGIGMAKACEIKAAFELGRRWLARRSGPLLQVRSSRDVAHYYMPMLAGLKREQFQALLARSQESCDARCDDFARVVDRECRPSARGV